MRSSRLLTILPADSWKKYWGDHEKYRLTNRMWKFKYEQV